MNHFSRNPAFSIALKIVVGYFLVFGILDLIWPIILSSPALESFRNQSIFVGQSTRYQETAQNVLRFIATTYIIVGLALLYRQRLAPGLAYVALTLSAFLSAKDAAWEIAGSKPSDLLYLSSLAFFLVLHGLIASVVYRNRKLFYSRNGAA